MQSSSSIQSSKNSPAPKESVTASKKTYEKLWRFIFLVISVIFAFLINKLYVYQTDPAFDYCRKGQFWNMMKIGIPFALFYSLLDSVIHFLFDGLCEKYYINQVKYSDPEARKKRCYTLVKWAFSLFYYGFTSLAAYLMIKDTSYFPTWLGGTGSPANLYNDFPENSQYTYEMEILYLVQFGKHFSRTFVHFLIRPEGNYYEYGLHHLLSIYLITFSYLADHWLIGLFVLMVHDFTDLFLILARGYKDYKNHSEKVLKGIYVFGFALWVFFRIFVFCYAFIYAFDYGISEVMVPKMEANHPPIFKQTLEFPARFLAGMLKILQGLQVFWTYYILKTYTSVIVTSKVAPHTEE